VISVSPVHKSATDAGQPPGHRLAKAARVAAAMLRDRRPLAGAWRLALDCSLAQNLGVSSLAFALKPYRPFGCAAWPPALKLARMQAHVALVRSLGGILLPQGDGPRRLADLSTVAPDLWLAIDEPSEMLQDGLTVLSLMEGQMRIFQVSFTLARFTGAHMQVFVGGIQGRQGELDLYRDMTKACHGMRPRDLLLEAFRLFCNALDVRLISAVANSATYHHDRYFGAYPYRPARMHYDTVWRDRGGRQVDGHWFHLPLSTHRRTLEEVPARKRALYRRRYAMLDEMHAIVGDATRQAIPAAGQTLSCLKHGAPETLW
jgi:uncharacterized protein